MIDVNTTGDINTRVKNNKITGLKMADDKGFNQTLEELNDEKAVMQIPVFVYIGLLMILGFIGNTLVCVYFGCKTRRTSTTIFVTLLAVLDLMACMFSMPGEIIDTRYPFLYENVFMCKFSKFVNHLTAAGSSITLVIIAIDRHGRICSPLRRQIQVKNAFTASSFTLIIALFFSWPALLFYGPTEVTILPPYDNNVTLTGYDCTATKDKNYSIFILIFNGIYFLMFVFLAVTVIILYCKIGRVVIKHSRHRSVRLSAPSPTSGSSELHTGVTEVSNNATELHVIGTETGGRTVDNTNTLSIDTQMPNEKIRKRSYTVAERQSCPRIDKQTLDSKTVKSTLIMIAITAAFIISCLPYLALVIWRTFKGGHETEFLTDNEKIFYDIGIRSFLLNNAINPILYGFLNDKFRRFICSSVCVCIRAKKV